MMTHLNSLRTRSFCAGAFLLLSISLTLLKPTIVQANPAAGSELSTDDIRYFSLRPLMPKVATKDSVAGGHEGSGGGVGYLCGQPGHQTVYLADTYDILHGPQTYTPGDFRAMAVPLTKNKIDRRIYQWRESEKLQQLKSDLKMTFNRLDFRPVPHLTLLNDDGLPEKPGCSKVQLAVQHFNEYSDRENRVEYDFNAYSLMPDSEKLMLRLHEALIKLFHQNYFYVRFLTAKLVASGQFAVFSQTWNTLGASATLQNGKLNQHSNELSGHGLRCALTRKSREGTRFQDGPHQFSNFPFTIGFLHKSNGTELIIPKSFSNQDGSFEVEDDGRELILKVWNNDFLVSNILKIDLANFPSSMKGTFQQSLVSGVSQIECKLSR